MPKITFSIIALALTVILSASCSEPTVQKPNITLLDMSSPEDMSSTSVHDLFDMKDQARTNDAGDKGLSTPDLGRDGQRDSAEDKEVRFVEFLQSEWEKETPCRGDVTPAPIEREFEYPASSAADNYGKSSREELEMFANGASYTDIHRWTFDSNLRPDQRGTLLFRQDDEDVRIYLHTTVHPDDVYRAAGILTVLVDYKPVEATYKYSQDRWENLLFSKMATGTRFPIDTQFSMMEVILPAELFTEERIYEIAVGQTTVQYGASNGGIYRKVHLLNRSTEQPSHPCHEEPLGEPANTIEYGLISENISTGVLLFPTYYPALSEVAFERLLPATPNQKVQINLSLVSKFNAEDRTRPVFLKPLLDGKPLEDQWRVSLSPKSPGSFNIDARKTFEVTLPEEPGIYEVSMAVWHDPNMMAVDLDGDTREGISTGGRGATSNLLRFEVKVPEDNSKESGD
jgi:hypothetical protein